MNKTSRRNFIAQSALASTAIITSPIAGLAKTSEANDANEAKEKTKRADGSRLVVSVSMQFEAGNQPNSADSPFPKIKEGYKDLPGDTWFQYGYKEGIPRMLDNWDKLGIKVTSHMVGAAVLKNPALAREIVERGHEAAAHGMDWKDSYNLPYEEEKKYIQDGVEAIKKVTGKTAIGYNANWLRRGENTLTILQELGFQYHIDDLSRDEPFIIQVNHKDFVVVPYTLRCNDILLIEGKGFSVDQFFNQVKAEFDQLYAESEFKRRQLSISFHDRIGGTPQMVKTTHDLIKYMQGHKDVSFKRKDEIAALALNDKTTIRE
jgi:peptidoglycan/xylan/chitin deacetylase (PgdA/CDA1 family)